MKKLLNWLASTIWWLSVACVLLSTLAIAGVRLSLEYLAEDPERLSNYLQTLTSKPVVLGQVDLDWRGATPIISIDHISYESNEVIVQLDTVELQPLLFASLLQLDIQFDLANAKTGNIEIFLDQFQGEASSIEDIISVLTTIIRAGNYFLSDITLQLHQSDTSQTIYIESARSLYSADSWTFDVKSEIPEFFSQLDIIVDHTGASLESSQSFDGRVYVKLDLSSDLKANSMVSLPQGLDLSSGKVEVWLDFINGIPQGIQANITDSNIAYANQNFQSVATSFIAQRKSPIPDTLPQSLESYLGMWDLYIPQLAFDFRKKKHQFDSLFFSQLNAGKNIWFSAKKIDTDIVMPFIIGMLPEQRTTLSQWPVTSAIHNLHGYVPLADPRSLVARATLEKLALGNKNNDLLQIGVTAADLSVSNQRALLKVEPSQVITLRTETVYDHWLTFTHPAAQIAIDWSNPDLISFSSDGLFVYLEKMAASIDLNYQLDLLEPHLSNLLLQVSAANVPVSLKDKLVPYKLLSNDLARTIRDDLKGQGNFSGNLLLFLQHGKSDQPVDLEIDLLLTTEKANITFADYPTANNFSGSIAIGLKEVSVQSPSFDMLLSQIDNLSLQIDSDNTLHLHGEVTDNVENLRTLAKAFESDLDFELPRKIASHGDIAVNVNIEVPLEDKASPLFDATVTLLDNQLQHTNYRDFPITHINGSFHITNTAITQDKPFKGRFADKPLTFGIENVFLDQNKILRLFADFTLPGEIINRLFALKVPLIKGTSRVDVLLDFNVASTEFERLIVDSQLTGIESDIPLGIGKKKGEQVATKFVLERQNKDLFFHLNVEDRIKGTILLDDTNKVNGWVGLGLAAKEPIAVSEEKLKILATYDTIDLTPLFDWFNANQFNELLEQNQVQIEGTLLNSLADVEIESNTQDQELDTSILDAIEVQFVADSIGTSNFFVHEAQVNLYRTDGVWVSDMTSDLLATKIYYATEGNVQQIVVDKLIIKKIVLPDDGKETQNPQKKTEDPLATFDPRIANPISLHIQSLSYNGSDLGKWSMELEPEADGLRLSSLEASRGTVVAKGNAFWQYLPDNEPGKQQVTTANLQVTGHDIQDFLGIVDSKSGLLEADLRWQASPIGVGPDNIKGTVNLDFKKGFINTEEESIALLNLIGLLNIETITKRLSLDFSDQGENIAYDVMQGKVQINEGLVTNLKPFIFKGPSLGMQLEGTTNLVTQEVDQTMVVQIPVGEALPLATVLAGFAPQVSVVLLIVNYALKKPFTQFTSARFKIQGALQDPEMSLDKLFNVPIDDTEEDLSSDE